MIQAGGFLRSQITRGIAGLGDVNAVTRNAVDYKKELCSIPNLMREQKPLKGKTRQLKMEKWVSSKNVNLIAKIQYKVNFSSKTK